MRQVVLTAPKQIEFRGGRRPRGGKPEIRRGVAAHSAHRYLRLGDTLLSRTASRHLLSGGAGHEYSAEVVAVGSAVRKVKPGDRVTGVRSSSAAGVQPPASAGSITSARTCASRPSRPTAWRRTTSSSPKSVSSRCPKGCRPTTARWSNRRPWQHATSRPRALEGRNVVVSGAGTIGNLVAQFARARGAKRVVITDVSDYRLSKARECGIERTLNVAREPLDGKIAELFGDEGYQVAFECAGVESSVRSLMATVEKGGDVVIVGVHAKRSRREHVPSGRARTEPDRLDDVPPRRLSESRRGDLGGRIRLAPLVSNRFPLEKYREAYEFIDANRETCMKVLIDLEDGKA